MKYYKIVWDFKQPAWGKKTPVRMKGEHSDATHPMTKIRATDLADELCRIYGAGTHWVEEVKK